MYRYTKFYRYSNKASNLLLLIISIDPTDHSRQNKAKTLTYIQEQVKFSYVNQGFMPYTPIHSALYKPIAPRSIYRAEIESKGVF